MQHFEDFPRALEQYGQALDLARRLNLPDKQIDILANLITVNKKLHREDEITKCSMKIDSIINTCDQADIDYSRLVLLGDNATRNGNFDMALSFYNKALAHADSTQEVAVLQKLRDTSRETGDYKGAVKYSEQCIEGWKKMFADHPSQKYMIYQNHYALQMKAGDFTGALASIDSLALSLEYEKSPLDAGQLYFDKGLALDYMNDWPGAIACYQKADSLLSLSDKKVAANEKIKMLVPIHASALFNNKEWERSREMLLRNADLTATSYGRKSMEYSNALCYLANIEGYLGLLDNGMAHYIESWEIIRDIAAQDLEMLPSNARGEYWKSINKTMWDMVPYALEANYQENRFTAAAFEALIMSKGLMLSLEKSTGKRIQSAGDERMISDFRKMANLRNEIERQRALGAGEEIMRLYASIDSIDKVLSTDLARHGITPVVTRLSTADISSNLDKGEAIADFADFVKKDGTHIYVAFVLKHGMDAPRVIKCFEQSAIDSLLAENNGSHPDLYLDYNQERMYDIVCRPLEETFEDISTIYLVPSGILNQIAVEAIRLPDGTYLGDRYNIVRLSHAKQLLTYKDTQTLANPTSARLYGGLKYDVGSTDMALAARQTELSPLLATRSANVDLKEGEGFKTLDESGAEVTEIADILTHRNVNVTTLMDMYGTEESFMAMSGNSPDLLLVSTHGFYFSPEGVPAWSSLNGYDNPMYLTGLVMSGGNAEYLKRDIPDGVMGGLLTSSDIAQLDLSDTKLVVLSACETGLGKTTNEGVYGLQRAFKKAGAQTLVMSLWPVSDVATKEFMTLFCSHLVANDWDKRSAFDNARRHIRQKYGNPHYWAAFIMVD